MTDKPVSVYFTAENRTFWLHGLFWGLVTLGLAFALRMLEWPCWQNPEYRLGSEWLLATHDAYHWVAGAEGFGHAVGHPMAVMLRGMADLLGTYPAAVAFWFPALLSCFVAVIVYAWVWALGSMEAGVAAGLQETGSLISSGTLPLLYAGAMLVDAVAALFFGLLYDKKGVRALVWSTVLSAPFAIFVFAGHSVASLLVGIALWGVGMGAQESILKAAVSSMVPKASRATGYGVFECAFGVFWFLGSWLLGVLYDVSIPAMIAVSVAAQLAAIPLYIASSRRIKANP